MKNVLALATLVASLSAVASPIPVASEIEMTKVLKVHPKAIVLTRSGPTATVGIVVQVGIPDTCHTFAGYWWMERKDAQGLVPLKKELNVGTSVRRFPPQACAEVYGMEDVVIPVQLVRGDEASHASDMFRIADAGSYRVSYDWKTGRASIESIATLE